MTARGLLIALMLAIASPQIEKGQTRYPAHVESLIYPPVGIMARVHGNAVLTAYIGPDGSVSITNRKSGHPMFLDAAEDNLKRWKFQSGESREIDFTYHFKLRESPSGSKETECVFDLPDSVTVTADPPPVEIIESSPKGKPSH